MTNVRGIALLRRKIRNSNIEIRLRMMSLFYNSVGAAFQPRKSRLKASPTRPSFITDKMVHRAMTGFPSLQVTL
jgi:hypothetical protein